MNKNNPVGFNLTLIAFLVTATVLTRVGSCAAEPLKGAAAILKSIAERAKEPDLAKPVSEGAKLRADLTNFTARAKSMAPAAAAQEWLGLLDRVDSNPTQVRRDPRRVDENPPRLTDLLAALPPPTVWDELAKAIAARPAPTTIQDARELGLRMLGSALTGDRPALTRLSSEFEAMLLKANRDESAGLLSTCQALDKALMDSSDDPKAIVAGVERQLLEAEREREFGSSGVSLPDLAGMLGEAEATPYVRRALVSKSIFLQIQGKATEALARKLALGAVNELKWPRWGLVDSLDCIDLYEAMEKRFDTNRVEKPANAAEALAEMQREGHGGYERQSARSYYLMALIVNGRAADAARLLREAAAKDGDLNLDTSVVTSLGRAGYTVGLDDFLFELLSESPDLPHWGAYFVTAAKTGKTGRMLKLARAAVANPELAGTTSERVRVNLYRALLAADSVEEGVVELRALLAGTRKSPLPPVRSSRSAAAEDIDWQEHALALARLGKLLEKPDWVAEGLTQALAISKENTPGTKDEYTASYQLKGLVRALARNDRPSEAESMLAENLAKEVALDSKLAGSQEMAELTHRAPKALALLAGFYDGAGRSADVLTLLEESPHWAKKDLIELVTGSDLVAGFDFEALLVGVFKNEDSINVDFALAAARALLLAGRKAEARTIADFVLDQSSGHDRAYELLIQLSGQDAMPRLDELFARDQFEERPLIWKATLLLQAGKLEEAEKVARQAVSIDPSDGEQGKGDRMRVYAVLADIRAARGDAKEAEFLRGVVRAIRQSERADDFRVAGLHTRAVKMYEESLKQFSDAYCIQSRLAVELSDLGQHELAAKHYEKAFELMPDSFGRVESHCFGCEGAFRGTQAQDVAERVFTKLAAANPRKPQIHYLLGYLRKQQGRGKEALPHFRRAVELDPDYLNAWKEMQELGQQHRLPSAERDSIALNILRLDPLERHGSFGRHATPDLGSVSDLRKLWAAVEAASKFEVKKPTSLLPLTASREAMEKLGANVVTQRNAMFGYFGGYGHDGGAPSSPGEALMGHPLIVAIANLIAMSEQQ